MTRLCTIPLALLCLLFIGAKGVPTTDEIRQMLADKQYRRVLREVARAQALKGDDAAGYDRGIEPARHPIGTRRAMARLVGQEPACACERPPE